MVYRTRQLPALQVPGWDTIPNLVHGFLGRRGGVSRGPFAELNLSYRVGDAPEMVQENWRRVRDTACGLRFPRMQQVHGDRVVTIEDADLDGGEADAMVTGTAGTAAGVLTADCVPILLVVPGRRVVAAVHAGWRGTLAGVARRAVQQIEQVFGTKAAEVCAALGPSIGGCCYEVDTSIADALEQRWGTQSNVVNRDRCAKTTVDLRRINIAILESAGVRRAQIANVGPCTHCAATEYFSYRAAQGPTGRQWSFIGWQA